MSINSEILALKTAGLNHEMIASVRIGVESEDGIDNLYPMLRIWPAPGSIRYNQDSSGKWNAYNIAVFDRHQDTPTSALEAISDCDQILADIIATMRYMYRSDRTFNIEVDAQVETFYDEDSTVVGGVGTVIRIKKSFTADFCNVPSRDFDFPVVNLSNLRVLDEGPFGTTYSGPFIIDGGIL